MIPELPAPNLLWMAHLFLFLSFSTNKSHFYKIALWMLGESGSMLATRSSWPQTETATLSMPPVSFRVRGDPSGLTNNMDHHRPPAVLPGSDIPMLLPRLKTCSLSLSLSFFLWVLRPHQDWIRCCPLPAFRFGRR